MARHQKTRTPRERTKITTKYFTQPLTKDEKVKRPSQTCLDRSKEGISKPS